MKHLTAGLILFLLAASVRAGRLTDNFDDGNMDEWAMHSPTLAGGESPNNTWRIENGELIVEAVDAPFNFLIGEAGWGDYTVGIRAKIVEFPEPNPCCAEFVLLLVRFRLDSRVMALP